MMYTFESKEHGHSFDVAYSTINMLANSQGSYGRMKAALEDQDWEPLYELTKENYFEDVLDFVMFIEQ